MMKMQNPNDKAMFGRFNCFEEIAVTAGNESKNKAFLTV